jgi:hypothetical protein
MDASAAARRLAAVNRHLSSGGGGGEAGEAMTTTRNGEHSMALPRSSTTVISPSAVSAARPGFRADRLLDGQVRGSVAR